MSKLIALRLPDDVYAEIEKRTSTLARGQSHFIINALRVYLEKIEPGNPASWQQFANPLPLGPQKDWTVAQVTRVRLEQERQSPLQHAESCKCLMCKPPKP